MTGKRYKFQTLCGIKQIDAELALKKLGGIESLNGFLSDYVVSIGKIFEKYDGNKIFENHSEFLDDIEALKETAEKFYATVVIWEADFLIGAFLNGEKKNILEKYDNFKSVAEELQKRIILAQCDEDGNLLTPQGLGNIYDDKELAEQPECGHTPSGYYAPEEKFHRLDELVKALAFDEALELTKKLTAVYYNEIIKTEIENLEAVMSEGEFEIAMPISENLLTLIDEYNVGVELRAKIIKPRVLVVDDVADILITIKGILSDICHVCTVTNYFSAMRFLENCHADLILLDIGLEEVDGFHLLGRIKKMPRYRETPVIFLTGNVNKSIILQAIEAGISDYLRKPVDAEILIERVRKLLGMDVS